MIKIFVSDEKTRNQLIEESKYIHNHRKVDIEKCSTLAHLYCAANELIFVDKELHGL